jgi:hypothetical protein
MWPAGWNYSGEEHLQLRSIRQRADPVRQRLRGAFPDVWRSSSRQQQHASAWRPFAGLASRVMACGGHPDRRTRSQV